MTAAPLGKRSFTDSSQYFWTFFIIKVMHREIVCDRNTDFTRASDFSNCISIY